MVRIKISMMALRATIIVIYRELYFNTPLFADLCQVSLCVIDL